MSWRLLSLSGSGEILTSGFKCGVCFFFLFNWWICLEP